MTDQYKYLRLLKLEEEDIQRNHPSLVKRDLGKCFYWREYKTYGGYNAPGGTNQLIYNLKIKDCQTHRLFYKNQAIQQTAKEMKQVLTENSNLERLFEKIYFVPIPTSDIYEKRLLKILETFKKQMEFPIFYEEIVQAKDSTKPAHQSDARPSIEELINNYKFNPSINKALIENKILIIFDDVLTKGNHYKAMELFISEYFKNIQIYGLFIARSVRMESIDEFD